MNKIFYGGPGDMQLRYTDPDKYIEDYLIDLEGVQETIEVARYRPMTPSIGNLPSRVLDTLLEYLDQEYGDPEGDAPDETEKMRELAEVFVRGVLMEYEPWACELIDIEIVNVAEWVRKNYD